VITFQVKQIVYTGKVLEDLTPFHIICWGLPTLLTFLPLFSVGYGSENDWCFFANPRNGYPQWIVSFWSYAAFYFWILLSMLLNFFFLLCSWAKVKALPVVNRNVKQTIKKLAVYPMVIAFCWLPNTVISTVFLFTTDVGGYSTSFVAFTTAMSASQGLFLSVAFFFLNPFVREKYRQLYRQFLVGIAPSVADLGNQPFRAEMEADYSGNGVVIVNETELTTPYSSEISYSANSSSIGSETSNPIHSGR
jgi:hypothetical protein